MLRSLAFIASLALALPVASGAAALECLNSKPCGRICIAYNKVCHPPPRCRRGYFRCGKGCIPDRDLCGIR
jgi:hypothetical protein